MNQILQIDSNGVNIIKITFKGLTMTKFYPNIQSCRGCIYFNPNGRNQQKKCSRFTGPKIGINKKGQPYCIVKDADGKLWDKDE